jgi:hypothetical protein
MRFRNTAITFTILGCLVFSAFSTAACAETTKRPNILFIIADDQSPFDLKVYSPDAQLETPNNIDRIAANGMVFDAAHHMGAWAGGVSGLNVQLARADGKVITIPRVLVKQEPRKSDKRQETKAPQPKVMGEDKPLDTTARITIRDNGKALKIHSGDSEVATYFYEHDQVQRPFFAHVKAPSGTQVTRNFPPGPGDPKDHGDMHPGLWLAFGDISGEDFWRNQGHVIHEQFTAKPTGAPGRGSFSHRKSYQRSDGRVLCVEDFRCTIHVLKEGYLLEWDSTFSAPEGGEFYFGDQEEMGLGIRVATEITEVAGGQITDSQNRQGAKEIWSQPAAWCDYSGVIGDEALGITILCHPDNFRESWLHARNYGLLAANPFGRKAMKNGPISTLRVTSDEPLRLRYGIFLHGHPPDLNQIHQRYVKLSTTESTR